MSQAPRLSELVRELEERYARPPRANLRALRAKLGCRRHASGPELWQRALELKVLPPELAACSERAFDTSYAQQRRLGSRSPWTGEHSLPPTDEMAVLLASDPEGVLAVEAHARELAARLEPWGVASGRRVVWRVCAYASTEDDSFELPPALYTLLGRAYPFDYPNPRFERFVTWLAHAQQWRARASEAVPETLVAWDGQRFVLPKLAGHTLSSIPDPFEPYLAIVRRGYLPLAIEADKLVLGVPKPLTPGLNPPIEGVWGPRTHRLRLAAARGDLGTLREHLPQQPRIADASGPPLTNFAVYGGAQALELLDEHGWLVPEARDAAGMTPLMYAASLLARGPRGAQREDLDVPFSALSGAKSCRYLAHAGAELDAADPGGWTALHWAVSQGHEPQVAALLELGARVDARDHLGRTPLMLALSELPGIGNAAQLMGVLGVREAETPPIVEHLLAASADVDLRDELGWNALHYLANATAGAGQRRLARRLVSAGATPSYDREGLSPAKICALHHAHHTDQGPFDPRTGVAAGPGRWPRLDAPPALVARLVEQLWRLPPIACASRPQLKGTRAQLEDWSVWADWLQSVGDPRGELVSSSLACLGLSGGKRKAQLDALARVQARAAASTRRVEHRVLEQARAQRYWRARPVDLRRRHGFVYLADLARADLEAIEQLEYARPLLHHEPLLTELRVGQDARTTGEPFDWPTLLAGLAALEPIPQLRRLVLVGLPLELPDLAGLRAVFPQLASLVLYPLTRFADGELHWPELLHLRIQHKTARAIADNRIELQVDTPEVTHLELGMRRHSLNINYTQLSEGSASNIARLAAALPKLEHLRISPGAVDVFDELLAAGLFTRLRRFEVGEVTYLVQHLAQFHEQLSGLEALGLIENDPHSIASYLERLAHFPQLHIADRAYR